MKEQTSTQVLERCLRELARRADVEAVLAQYPQYMDELRPLLEAASAVEQLYRAVPEPPHGLAAGRARFLAAARQHRQEARAGVRRRMGMPRLVRRLVGVALAVVIGITVAGGGVAWAASGSLPGSSLYPVKLSIENVRMAVTTSPRARVGLALRFADERMEEIQALADAGLSVPGEVVDRMESHLEQALMQAMAAPEGERAGLLEQVAQHTQSQAQVLERVQARAPEQAQAGLSRALAVCLRGHQAATAALGDGKPHRGQQGEGGEEERGRYPPEMPTFVSPVRPSPGQERTPPGQEWTPPGQERTPPGQERTPPGQEQTPPGQERTPPGQERTPPGQEQTPPGQEQTPPGQGDQGGGGKGKGKGGH